MYTTLLMSTGLTFGTISALYGLTHDFITREQYTILVTVVILSAVVPTVIAERWFDPNGSPKERNGTFSEDEDRTAYLSGIFAVLGLILLVWGFAGIFQGFFRLLKNDNP